MNELNVREGTAEVPGARLRYRLAGTPGMPLLVFENGWGASYEMWTWMERELTPHAQLLFYNRAGIGGSEQLASQTVAGLSTQFAALPAVLGLQGPVTAVGQSYGGLMCALHAAQRRDVLRAVVEIDPTSEAAHPEIDEGLRRFPAIVKLVQRGLRLGLPNLLFNSLKKSLPKVEARTMLRVSLGNPASLDAGLAELALLDAIRAAIAAGRPRDFPRLLIGAACLSPLNGLVARMLANPRHVQASFDRNKAFQRERTMQDPGCRLLMLPYDHGALVFTQDGARATAAAIVAAALQSRADSHPASQFT